MLDEASTFYEAALLNNAASLDRDTLLPLNLRPKLMSWHTFSASLDLAALLDEVSSLDGASSLDEEVLRDVAFLLYKPSFAQGIITLCGSFI